MCDWDNKKEVQLLFDIKITYHRILGTTGSLSSSKATGSGLALAPWIVL